MLCNMFFMSTDYTDFVYECVQNVFTRSQYPDTDATKFFVRASLSLQHSLHSVLQSTTTRIT